MAGTVTRPAFSYRAGKTILHRAPAGLKLLCVIALSAAAFFSVYGLAASCGLLLAASVLARIPPWNLLKGSKPLLLLSVCIVAVKLKIPNISVGNFIDGAIAVARIFIPFAAASLLFAVTTMGELRASLAKAEIGLKKMLFPGDTHSGDTHGRDTHSPGDTHPGRDTHTIAYFSLGISLMLGFIPRFFYLWELSGMACDGRSCKRGLRRLLILIPLVTERMMEAAAETALALESRGLGVVISIDYRV